MLFYLLSFASISFYGISTFLISGLAYADSKIWIVTHYTLSKSAILSICFRLYLVFDLYLAKICLNRQTSDFNCDYWLWGLRKSFKYLKQMKITKHVAWHLPGKRKILNIRTIVSNWTKMLTFYISISWNISTGLMQEKALGTVLNSSLEEIIHGSAYFQCVMIKTQFTRYCRNHLLVFGVWGESLIILNKTV